MWHAEKQGMLNSLWFKVWVCPSVSVEIRVLEQVGGSPGGLSSPQLEENVLISVIRPHLVWSKSATIGDSCCGWCHFSTTAHFSPILQHNDLGSNISPGLRVLMKQIYMLFSCQSVFCARSLLLKPEVWKKSLSLSTVTIPVTGIWTQLYILSKHAKLFI